MHALSKVLPKFFIYLIIVISLYTKDPSQACKLKTVQKISNESIHVITGTNRRSDEISRRHWNWIRRVLRRESNNDSIGGNGMAARRQKPSRLIQDHLEKDSGKGEKTEELEGWNSWDAVRGPAAARTSWKTRVAALCASWRREH